MPNEYGKFLSFLQDSDIPRSQRQIDKESGNEDLDQLIIIAESMQHLWSHFPGGETEEGSDAYLYTIQQLAFLNEQNQASPRAKIVYEHKNLGRKVGTLWSALSDGNLDLRFDSLSENKNSFVTTERYNPDGILVSNHFLGIQINNNIEESLPYGSITITSNLLYEFEQDKSFMLGMIAGMAHVVYSQENARKHHIFSQRIMNHTSDSNLRLQLTNYEEMRRVTVSSDELSMFAFAKFYKQMIKYIPDLN